MIGFVFFSCGGDEGVRSKQRLRNSEVSEFTRINAASTLNDLLQATMLRIRATNRTIVGYVRCARFPQMQALASLFACGQPEGVHAAGGTASPCRAPEKKTNPIVIGFVFFVSGGDEGGRTPYLLNAIQALYQLSYTPKADNKRKYTIFTAFCQLHLNK